MSPLDFVLLISVLAFVACFMALGWKIFSDDQDTKRGEALEKLEKDLGSEKAKRQEQGKCLLHLITQVQSLVSILRDLVKSPEGTASGPALTTCLTCDDLRTQGITGEIERFLTVGAQLVFAVFEDKELINKRKGPNVFSWEQEENHVIRFLNASGIDLGHLKLNLLLKDQREFTEKGLDVAEGCVSTTATLERHKLSPKDCLGLLRWANRCAADLEKKNTPPPPEPAKKSPEPKSLQDRALDVLGAYKAIVEETKRSIVDEDLCEDAINSASVSFRSKLESVFAEDESTPTRKR